MHKSEPLRLQSSEPIPFESVFYNYPYSGDLVDRNIDTISESWQSVIPITGIHWTDFYESSLFLKGSLFFHTLSHHHIIMPVDTLKEIE